MKISETRISRSLLALADALILIAGGCRQAVTGSPATEHKAEKMVAILSGVIGDQGWNKINYKGILERRETLGADLEFTQNVAENDLEVILTEYGSRGYGLVVTAGSQPDDAASMVVPRFPNTIFCVVNGPLCQGRNTAPIFPEEYEASYLASIIAGNMTQNGILGIIAGYPGAPMEHLLDVYEKNAVDIILQRGVKNPQTLGSYVNSWSNVDLGKKAVKQMVDSGMNTLLIYANEVEFEYIQTAKERQVRVIGFFDNQNGLESGTVAVSVYFDFGTLYRWTVEQCMDGKLQSNKVYEVDIRKGIFAPVFPGGIPEGLRDAVNQGTSDFLRDKADLAQWFSS